MTIILVLTIGAALILWVTWIRCMVDKRAEEQAERQARQAVPPGVSMDDLLILAGSEGDNLPGPETIYTRGKKPGLDYRAEVSKPTNAVR